MLAAKCAQPENTGPDVPSGLIACFRFGYRDPLAGFKAVFKFAFVPPLPRDARCVFVITAVGRATYLTYAEFATKDLRACEGALSHLRGLGALAANFGCLKDAACDLLSCY